MLGLIFYGYEKLFLTAAQIPIIQEIALFSSLFSSLASFDVAVFCPLSNTLVWFCTRDRQRAMYKAIRSLDRSKPVSGFLRNDKHPS